VFGCGSGFCLLVFGWLLVGLVWGQGWRVVFGLGFVRLGVVVVWLVLIVLMILNSLK
jgi:hypothetical protein